MCHSQQSKQKIKINKTVSLLWMQLSVRPLHSCSNEFDSLQYRKPKTSNSKATTHPETDTSVLPVRQNHISTVVECVLVCAGVSFCVSAKG